MKRKGYRLLGLLGLSVCLLGLFSCSNEHSHAFLIDFVYQEAAEDGDTDALAIPTYDGAYLSEDSFPFLLTKDISFYVAGDKLEISYSGSLHLDSSLNCYSIVNGSLLSHSYTLTQVNQIGEIDIKRNVTGGIEGLNGYSSLPYVITNKLGSCQKLENYLGTSLYVSFDDSKLVSCPKGAVCGAQPFPSGCLTSFDPR